MANRKIREYGSPMGAAEPGAANAGRPMVGPADAQTRRKRLKEALEATETTATPAPFESRARNKEALDSNQGTVALRERQLRKLGV
jgi:hypothetical protein